MAKKAPFFSHDMNARHDPKISAMRGVYGSEGYGWFWMLIELMAESDGYQLDCKSRYTFNAYAMQLQCKTEDVQKFITDCIVEFELFESDSMYFWSNSLRNRMQYRDAVSEKKAAAANKRWEKPQDDANGMHMHNTCNADAMQNHANKTKQNKTKLNVIEYMQFDEMPHIKITDKQFEKLVNEIGSEDKVMGYIFKFASWILTQPKKKQETSSVYLSIVNWHKRDLAKPLTPIISESRTSIPTTAKKEKEVEPYFGRSS